MLAENDLNLAGGPSAVETMCRREDVTVVDDAPAAPRVSFPSANERTLPRDAAEAGLTVLTRWTYDARTSRRAAPTHSGCGRQSWPCHLFWPVRR